ncbi:MAG TPA: phage major capsid protein [Candidatus Baltobacteraceae bacterium]|nr:phage major capsid protein [Candidatus Baltobacteraceae bacterium]
MPDRTKSANITDIRNTARELLSRGLTPLPLSGKKPIQLGWQAVTVSADQIDRLFTAGLNIGLRLEKFTDVDLDAPEARSLGPYFLKETAASWGRDSARHSHHLYDVADSRYEEFIDPLAKNDEEGTLLEIRHDTGHQTMIPPSVHPETGEILRWEAGPFPQPPKWTYPEMRRAAGKIAAAVLLIRHMKMGAEHFVWLYLSGAMARAEWTKEEARHFCSVVSQAHRDDKPKERLASVESSFERREEGEVIAGIKKLEEHLEKPIVRKLANWLGLKRVKADLLDLDDDSNAQAVFIEHGDDLRYLPSEGKGGLWLFWNDTIWQRDHLSRVEHLAAETLKKKAEQLTTKSRDFKLIEKVKRELLNVGGVNGALERLSWYPEIALEATALDSDPWLVGLSNGVYNLQTGALEDGAREQLVSRQIAAACDRDAKCPRWIACLERAQPSVEMIAFLQRLGTAAWYVNDATLEYLRNLLDKQGHPIVLFRKGLTDVDSDRPYILGRPVAICPSMPTMASGHNSVVLADPFYFVQRRVPSSMYVRRFTENATMIQYGLVGFESFFRVDSNLVAPNPSYLPAQFIQNHS